MMMRLVLFCAILSVSFAYSGYKQYIPNGRNVPNPCPHGKATWSAAGHTDSHGGGARNLFGMDFASSAHVWTHDLCMTDSDLDGKRNGEELGDPHCKWSPGQTPDSAATGHPGICEPINDPKCQSVNLHIVC
ncbi:temptin-like [Ylistrum balloti]|uniref:temptin-like n=1 Tax=Ylistrum balloti TaxID=509963 RepID=UPI002905A001|nr:temptin-like [Ylistrum balloti]